jgi:hypothetical protein
MSLTSMSWLNNSFVKFVNKKVGKPSCLDGGVFAFSRACTKNLLFYQCIEAQCLLRFREKVGLTTV